MAEHGATVLRVCRAVVGPVDAEDAWSETFLSALRAYPDLPADANVEAWLVTIAHRRAVDVGRARSRRPVPTDTLPERPAAHADPAARDPDLWTHCSDCPPNNARRWPTTTSPACRSPTSPNCSATPPTPRAAPPPTDSRHSASTIVRTKQHDYQHL